jgi:hypothetical protein
MHTLLPEDKHDRSSAESGMRESIIIIHTKDANRVYDRLNHLGIGLGSIYTEYMNFTLCPMQVQLDELKELRKRVRKK